MKLRGLYQKTDSKIWYYQPPQAKGVRPKPISLGTKDEAEAVQLYHEVVSQAREVFRRGSLRMEIARYIQEMRLKGKHRPATSEHCEQVLGQLVERLGNISVDLVTSARLEAIQGEWIRRGLSASTVASYFARISAFFAWAKKEGLTKQHPVEPLHYERDFGTRSERYCTKEQRDALLAGAPVTEDHLATIVCLTLAGGRWTGPLVRIDVALCLWLGAFAGLRRNEMVEARRDWVDLDGGVLHVRRTDTFIPKGKKGRIIRMSPRLRAFLVHYCASVDFGADHAAAYLLRPDKPQGRKQKTRGKKAWRYRFDPRAPVEAHCRERGLPWVNFHVLRHTFGTLHALAGTPLSTIAREMGDQLRVVERAYIGYTKSNSHSAAAD